MTTKEREQQPLAAFAYRGGDDIVPPGYMREGDKADDGVGNYTVEDLAFKGYVRVWDNRTGVMSLQPRWLLWQTFQLKRPEDGSFIFTDRDPGIAQDYGMDMLCMLHPQSPSAPLFAGMGFRLCLKKHTPTQAALEKHMEKSHKRAYATMKQRIEGQKRDEDRALQMEVIHSNQAMVKALAGNVTKSARAKGRARASRA